MTAALEELEAVFVERYLKPWIIAGMDKLHPTQYLFPVPSAVRAAEITLQHRSDTPATRSHHCRVCAASAPYHRAGCPQDTL